MGRKFREQKKKKEIFGAMGEKEGKILGANTKRGKFES